MKQVVIIGAGGHAREVADILRDRSNQVGDLKPIGFVVEHNAPASLNYDLPILGDWSWFNGTNVSDFTVICAVGEPSLRKRLVERVSETGLTFAKAISPRAQIAPRVEIGDGVMIFPYTVISTNVSIGDHSIVNSGATISHDSKVGRFTTISPGVHVAGNVHIEEGCYLGIGANIIQRVNVKPWTVIGAGATVIHDLPEAVTAVGVPARPIKTRETF
jgi:sugar O-acyltransferase (sialic acid O-acetyltransferase NeuD family)